jgi:acetyl-CoA C-acetyltransferase
VLAAGLPDDVTGVTLNRFCGSGLQAINFAAMGVGSGHQGLVLAGGVESMSRVPMGSDGAGIDGNNVHLRKKVFQVPQGISADLIATRDGFTRGELDAFALLSQHRAEAAQKEGRFARALFPVRDSESERVLLEVDELPAARRHDRRAQQARAGVHGMGAAALGPNGETLDDLARARYPEVSKIEHLHTAGNSSGIVDGACAVLLASDDVVAHARAASAGAHPRDGDGGRRAGHHADGTDACVGSARSSARAWRRSDIDLWEINEAFAVVPLQTMKNLGIDSHEKVNVNGGAIALGHPLGATGAILLSDRGRRARAARSRDGARDPVHRRRHGRRRDRRARVARRAPTGVTFNDDPGRRSRASRLGRARCGSGRGVCLSSE